MSLEKSQKFSSVVDQKEIKNHDLESITGGNAGSLSSSSTHKELTYDDIQVDGKIRWKLFWSFGETTSGNDIPKSNKQSQSSFWYLPNATSKERKLYLKLDCWLLTFVSLSFFMKYLEQSAFQNAYVSGLQEAYGLSGSDYNWINEAYALGYSVLGLGGVMLLPYFPPRIVFPIFELLWGVFCMLMAAPKTKAGIMAVRCIQGGLSGFSFPAINYVLGTFYPPELISSRTAIFIFSGCVGPIVGGFIQSGLYGSLAHKAIGIPAYKLAQIVDGIIVIPIAIFGYFAIPPTEPGQGNFYLQSEEIAYLRDKTQQIANVDENHQKLSWSFVYQVLTSWQLWVFNLAYTASQLAEHAGGYQSIVLKSEGYSVYACDNLPTIQSAVKAISSLIAGVLCDYRGCRHEVYLVVLCFWITGLAILVKYDVARIAQFIAYAFVGVCAPASVIVLSWANDMCRTRGPAFRSAILGSLNLVLQFSLAPISILVYDTKYSPRFSAGMKVGLAMAVLQVAVVGILSWCDKYETRVKNYIDKVINSENESTPISSERP